MESFEWNVVKKGKHVPWLKRGQATVEAAFVLPILMILVLLLLQPALFLYSRQVMQASASEACRLLATTPETEKSLCESFIRRRLSAIPQTDIFHVHQNGHCSWDIRLEGDESTPEVSVGITGEIKPLPLIDGMGTLLGITNERGNLVVRVDAQAQTQPSWIEGGNPQSWIGSWIS